MRIVSLLVALCLIAAPVFAQQATPRFETRQDSVSQTRAGWSALRVAKWTTLLASTSAAIYGFAENRVADREYEDIERMCRDTPSACETAEDSGAYTDPQLETRYQNVLRRDDRARFALLTGQIGLAASLLMFILDLPANSTPDDIPYDPRALRVDIGARKVEIGYRFELR